MRSHLFRLQLPRSFWNFFVLPNLRSLLLSESSNFRVSLIFSFLCQVFDNDAPATHHSRSRSIVRSVSELAAINEAEPLVSMVAFLFIIFCTRWSKKYLSY